MTDDEQYVANLMRAMQHGLLDDLDNRGQRIPGTGMAKMRERLGLEIADAIEAEARATAGAVEPPEPFGWVGTCPHDLAPAEHCGQCCVDIGDAERSIRFDWGAAGVEEAADPAHNEGSCDHMGLPGCPDCSGKYGT